MHWKRKRVAAEEEEAGERGGELVELAIRGRKYTISCNACFVSLCINESFREVRKVCGRQVSPLAVAGEKKETNKSGKEKRRRRSTREIPMATIGVARRGVVVER